MDPANARPCGEQQFPKLEGAGFRLSLECWRQAQDKLFPLNLPSVSPSLSIIQPCKQGLLSRVLVIKGNTSPPTAQAGHTGAG